MSTEAQIGVIGGTGLYQIDQYPDAQEIEINTPFGKPSDKILLASVGSRKVAFLPRHSRHHSLLPSEIPFKANIFAMKTLGVKWLISASAVGSLKENLHPGDFLVPDQFFDRTKNPHHTFFGNGIVAHIGFAHPVCDTLATVLYQSASAMGATTHWKGTYVNMEGPAFSTRAECDFHRQLGYDVIGMTNLAEAKLAREAEISYASLAMVTDYDCWHQSEEHVSVESVTKILKQNAELGSKTILHAISQIPLDKITPHHSALANAILTPPDHWNPETTEKLRPILKPYLP